jgi:hypothetical protein
MTRHTNERPPSREGKMASRDVFRFSPVRQLVAERQPPEGGRCMGANNDVTRCSVEHLQQKNACLPTSCSEATHPPLLSVREPWVWLHPAPRREPCQARGSDEPEAIPEAVPLRIRFVDDRQSRQTGGGEHRDSESGTNSRAAPHPKFPTDQAPETARRCLHRPKTGGVTVSPHQPFRIRRHQPAVMVQQGVQEHHQIASRRSSVPPWIPHRHGCADSRQPGDLA